MPPDPIPRVRNLHGNRPTRSRMPSPPPQPRGSAVRATPPPPARSGFRVVSWVIVLGLLAATGWGVFAGVKGVVSWIASERESDRYGSIDESKFSPCAANGNDDVADWDAMAARTGSGRSTSLWSATVEHDDGGGWGTCDIIRIWRGTELDHSVPLDRSMPEPYAVSAAVFVDIDRSKPSVVVVASQVYQSRADSLRNELAAYDIASGQRIWTRRFNGVGATLDAVYAPGYFSARSVDELLILVEGSPDKVVAVSGRVGTTIWTVRCPRDVPTGLFLDAQRILECHSYDKDASERYQVDVSGSLTLIGYQ